MNNILGVITIIIFLCGLLYGFVRQIKETNYIIKKNKLINRDMIGNLICSISYGLFVLSYVLNILITIKGIEYSVITFKNISLSCGIFLVVALIGKYIIVPKKY